MKTSLIDLDETNFARELADSRKPFLVEFTARWCGPCRALLPVIDSIANERSGGLRVGVVDLDASPDLAARFDVRGVPTLILFENGHEVGRHHGATTKQRLLAWMDASVSSSSSIGASRL